MFMGLWSIAVVCVSVMKSVLDAARNFLETETWLSQWFSILCRTLLYQQPPGGSFCIDEMFYNVPSITVAVHTGDC